MKLLRVFGGGAYCGTNQTNQPTNQPNQTNQYYWCEATVLGKVSAHCKCEPKVMCVYTWLAEFLYSSMERVPHIIGA